MENKNQDLYTLKTKVQNKINKCTDMMIDLPCEDMMYDEKIELLDCMRGNCQTLLNFMNCKDGTDYEDCKNEKLKNAFHEALEKYLEFDELQKVPDAFTRRMYTLQGLMFNDQQ